MSDFAVASTISAWLSAQSIVIGLAILGWGGWRRDSRGWSARRVAALPIVSSLYTLAMSVVFRQPLGPIEVLAASIALTVVWFFTMVQLLKSRWFQRPNALHNREQLPKPQTAERLKPRFRVLATAGFVAGIVVCSPLWYLVVLMLGSFYGIGPDEPVKTHPNGGSIMGAFFFVLPLLVLVSVVVGMWMVAVGCAATGDLTWSEARAVGARWQFPDRWMVEHC
jgi:hypothetical protein